MDYKKTNEELNVPLLFSPDVKVQQDQQENMVVMGFLPALFSKYDSFKSPIMSNPKVSPFQETFSGIFRTEISSPALPPAQISSVVVVCYYYRKPRHVIRDCKKLQNRNQRFLSAHIASSNEAFDQSVQFSA